LVDTFNGSGDSALKRSRFLPTDFLKVLFLSSKGGNYTLLFFVPNLQILFFTQNGPNKTIQKSMINEC